MFITTAGFKKLLKEAYKAGGIRIGKVRDTYCIAGSYWAVQAYIWKLPKEALAAIIELAGEFPEDGKWFRARKDEPNQYEIDTYDEFRPMDRLRSLEEDGEDTAILNVTQVVLDPGNCVRSRVLQDGGTGKVTLVAENIMEMISAKALTNGEDWTEGPEAGRFDGVIFRNNTMAMLVLPRMHGDLGETLQFFESMDLPLSEVISWQ